ncbi:hypothetical protein BDR03DRAFT_1010579 [Suillus americanus]|nr:hypothetical protein BDR03DRAFT_1010579 [Suillus americanus]
MLPHLLHHSSNSDSDQLSTNEEYVLDPTNKDEGDQRDQRDQRDEGQEGEECNEGDAEQADKKALQGVINLFHNIIVSASEVFNNVATEAYNSYTNTYYDKEPYHTSVLWGIDWVDELLKGHPERI